VNARQRVEESHVGQEEAKITSDMDKDFALDIQSGTFEGDTVVKLQVTCTVFVFSLTVRHLNDEMFKFLREKKTV